MDLRCRSICPGPKLGISFCQWWHTWLWQHLSYTLFPFRSKPVPSLAALLHYNALVPLPALPETSLRSTADIYTLGDTSHRLVRSLIIAFGGFPHPKSCISTPTQQQEDGQSYWATSSFIILPSIFLVLPPLPFLCSEISWGHQPLKLGHQLLPIISITSGKLTIAWNVNHLRWSKNALHGLDCMEFYSNCMEVFQHIALGEQTFSSPIL